MSDVFPVDAAAATARTDNTTPPPAPVPAPPPPVPPVPASGVVDGGTGPPAAPAGTGDSGGAGGAGGLGHTPVLGPDDYTVPATAADDTPLTRIIGGASGAAYNDRLQYLKYNAVLTTKTKIGGRDDVSRKNVQYNIQAHRAQGNIPRRPAGGWTMDDTFKVSDSLQNDITYASVKNAAFPKTFTTMTMSGVMERLWRGVTVYAMYGILTPANLRGGGNINVRSILASTDNIAVGPGNVFVTNRMSERIRPATICALLNAISGEGGTAFTDLVAIDNVGIPQVPVFNDGELALGCLDAIQQVARMMVDCEHGPSMALASFRGVNHEATLAGHSDEGGIVRTVLRRGHYELPSGAVLLGDNSRYTGIPSAGGGVRSMRRLVFSVLLGGAAGSANSDPLIRVGDKTFPTILSLSGGPDEDPGTPDPAAVDDAERDAMQTLWVAAAGPWAKNFVYYLGRLFAAPGDTRSGVRCVGVMADDIIGMNENHLRQRVCVAFAWVEPTSITPFWDASLPAFEADCGALTIEGVQRLVPQMRDTVIEENMDSQHISMVVNLRYMRRHGLLVHLTSNVRDGMRDLALFSGTPAQFANVGGAGDLAPRILAGNGLNTYQWGRLHNQIIAIGEFVDFNTALRIVGRLYTVADPAAPWNIAASRCPTPAEIVGKKVCYTTARPAPDENPAALVVDNRPWSRSRTATAKSLVVAALRNDYDGRAWGGSIRPVIGDPMAVGPGLAITDPITRGLDGHATEPIVMDDINTMEGAEEPSAMRAGPAYAMGVPIPLVIHNVADRGPRAARPGGRGAAGGPPPAGPGAARGGRGGRGGGGRPRAGSF